MHHLAKKAALAFCTVAAATTLTGCTDAPKATRTLEQAGYTDIETRGYSFFGCGEDDTFRTKFTAKNPAGQKVDGVVCSGWLKGGTIRF